MTKQEEQDEKYASVDIHFDGEYETPELTDVEYRTIQDFAAFICSKSEDMRRFLGRDTNLFYIIRYHNRIPSGLIDEFSHTEGRENFMETNGKIEKLHEYERIKDFIINDGGEIRDGPAFQDDGETVKPGWVRFYWK